MKITSLSGSAGSRGEPRKTSMTGNRHASDDSAGLPARFRYLVQRLSTSGSTFSTMRADMPPPPPPFDPIDGRDQPLSRAKTRTPFAGMVIQAELGRPWRGGPSAEIPPPLPAAIGLNQLS